VRALPCDRHFAVGMLCLTEVQLPRTRAPAEPLLHTFTCHSAQHFHRHNNLSQSLLPPKVNTRIAWVSIVSAALHTAHIISLFLRTCCHDVSRERLEGKSHKAMHGQAAV
jgi:hypothetical protein